MEKDRRGVVLIFALLVVLVVSALLSSFYFRSIGENQLARRYADSTSALWLAEAGLAYVKSVSGLPVNVTSTNLPDANHTFNVTCSAISGTYNYTVVSTGTVRSPAGTTISRVVNATIQTSPPDPASFRYAIETTTELELRGSYTITPQPEANYTKEFSNFVFSDLFGITKVDMKTSASDIGNLFTNITSFDMDNAHNITWIDVSSLNNGVLEIDGGEGSGILIINGDCKFKGNTNPFGFNGIIYVIGELTMEGTPEIYGSMLAESSATVDTTVAGNAELNWNLTNIQSALDQVTVLLPASSKTVVSWKED